MSLRIFIKGYKKPTQGRLFSRKNNIDYLDFGGNCAKILATNSLIIFLLLTVLS
jgi:hypothetical protein